MPLSMLQLQSELHQIDGRSYSAYRDITGEWVFDGGVRLFVDHVQADPFAAPSRLRLAIPWTMPEHLLDHEDRQRGAAGYMLREASLVIQTLQCPVGSGHSGRVYLDVGGQELLTRTALVLKHQEMELRLSLGLPAAGRRVLGRTASTLLTRLVEAIACTLALDEPFLLALREWADAAEDQAVLRRSLAALGLVAFVPDGAVLPRASGVSDLPLATEAVVPFQSPPSLRVALPVPHRGEVTGMGIPRGVTLIVGGGYHGKSTLLRALERGVYDHVPGDGRELLVTLESAVKVRAEDGRSVAGVDISPFIADLPGGQPTQAFYTGEASGSTSQAANIMEALELPCRLLLMDEDTSATNFLIRDARMQRLVVREEEPITAFLDRVRELAEQDVSTIMVMGGSGDYFQVADLVIKMDAYRPSDVTMQARMISEAMPTGRAQETRGGPLQASQRIPLPGSVAIQRRGRPRAEGRGLGAVLLGDETIDVSQVEQLVDASQTRAIAAIMAYARRHYVDGQRSMAQVLNLVYEDVRRKGLGVISPYSGHPGDYAHPRPHEVLAAFNRLRTLRTNPTGHVSGNEIEKESSREREN